MMVEEEKQEIEKVEEKPVEKIGFNSPGNHVDPNDGTPSYKKKIKFSNQRKTRLQKLSFGFFIPAMILSTATLSFFFMPVLSALAGIMAFIIIGVIIVVPVMATVFLILLSEPYRQFVGQAWKVVEWFFDATNHISELSPFYPYLAFPTLVINIVEIVLCIVTLEKGQKGVVTYLITTSLATLAIIIVTIIYFALGMQVPHQ